MTTSYVPPAQLWLGSPTQLKLDALAYLQQQLCTQHGCGSCTMCAHIFEKQHHALLWISPEKQYTLETLEPVKTACAYALADNERFFFVLEQAQLLSIACQNSLLKLIEEPPTGYHFILLSDRLDPLLPTIQSRCIITHMMHTSEEHQHPLIAFFSKNKDLDPSQLLKILDEHKPNEQESIALCNQLLAFWLSEYKHAHYTPQSPRTKHAIKAIDIFKNNIVQPPMPGSSALFWKNIYLHITM